MRCCPDCFKDELVREQVKGLASRERGRCDLCESESEYLVEVTPEFDLAEQFSDLLSVFVGGFGVSGAFGSLYEAFFQTWDVMNDISPEKFEAFLKAMFLDDARVMRLLSGSVVLDPSPDAEDDYALCFFGKNNWEDFSKEVKYKHRYRPRLANERALRRILKSLKRIVHPEDSLWYRARCWNNKDKDSLHAKELKEAPEGASSEGRMSPRGVSCLYISNSLLGSMAEIRSARHDDVAILVMIPTRDLEILDLSHVDRISPFNVDVDCRELASNLENLRQMKESLVKPMRATDDELEYVPTQFIADFARSLGFDGIGYESVLYESDKGDPSYNIACFCGFDDAFEQVDLQLHRVHGSMLGSEMIYSEKAEYASDCIFD